MGNKMYQLTPAGRFCLLFLSLVLSLVIAELIVRIAVNFPLEKEYLRFYCYNHNKIPPDKYDKDLFWKPVEEFKGIRYAKRKPPNTFRIICIGDSVTQGDAGKGRLLPQAQTYVYKLEQLLRNKNNGMKKVEIINAGSGGYSSLQGRRYLKKKLWKYEPDLVISWFGINDSYYSLFYEDKQQKVSSAGKAAGKNVLERSRLYLFVKNYYLIKNAMAHPLVRVPPNDYYENCEGMVLFAKEKNFKIVFIVPFEVDSGNYSIKRLWEYQEKLDVLSNTYDCKVINLEESLEGPNLKKLFIDLCHPNEAGNTIIAQAIYTQLNEQMTEGAE